MDAAAKFGPPRAPEVSFFAAPGDTLGNQQTLLTGFQTPDGSRWGRPVAAVVGPAGAVYVTDDAAGAVYRMVPPPGDRALRVESRLGGVGRSGKRVRDVHYIRIARS